MFSKDEKGEDQSKLISQNKRKLINYWLPPLIWASVIFLFSSLPTGEVSEIHWKDFFVKKAAHLTEYATLTILFYRAFLNSNFEKKKAALFAIMASVLYGLTDELHQSFTPGRKPRLYDVFFDTIGSLIGIYGIWKLLPKAPKQLKSWAKKLQIS